jgi:hypothetical protein
MSIFAHVFRADVELGITGEMARPWGGVAGPGRAALASTAQTRAWLEVSGRRRRCRLAAQAERRLRGVHRLDELQDFVGDVPLAEDRHQAGTDDLSGRIDRVLPTAPGESRNVHRFLE